MKKHKQKPSRSEAWKVNNHTGYLISMEDRTGSELMYIHMLWLKKDNLLFKLIGFAPQALESDLQKTARSLRKLTTDEQKAIEVYKIRIVQVKPGESLAALSKRTSNSADLPIISVMNGLAEDATLTKNQLIKVVKREAYSK